MQTVIEGVRLHVRQTFGSKVMGQSRFPVCHICMFTPCHIKSIVPLGGQVSVPGAGPQSCLEGTSHAYIEERKKEKERAARPLRASSIRHVQTGCGRMEGVPWGRLSSTRLSLPSCPHPLCRRRNRRLRGPGQGRRSASYISTLLSWGWEAEFARALIIAVGLRWPPPGTVRGSLG